MAVSNLCEFRTGKISISIFLRILYAEESFHNSCSDAEVFKEKLEAKIVIEHNKGHFSGSDGIKELPSALDSVLEIAEYTG